MLNAPKHRPKLQLALDHLDLDAALELVALTADYVDIVEVGTPCLKVHGATAIQRVKEAAHGKPVLADLKTMDAGEYESTPFFQLGASICTVLGAASRPTIQGVIQAARHNGGQVQVDLINVANPMQVAEDVCALGVDILGIHTGIDSQLAGETPFADLRAISQLALNCTISVAGGLGPDSARLAADLGADIIVVGGKISGADDPRAVAQSIQAALS